MHFEKDDNRRNRAGCDDERDGKIRERRRDRNYFDIWFVNLRGIQIGRPAMIYTFFQSRNQRKYSHRDEEWQRA